MKRFSNLFLSVSILFLSFSSFAAKWYVDDASNIGDVYTLGSANGNNLAPGDGSSSAPFATLSHAFSVAAAGDIIYVDKGSFSGGGFNTLTFDKSITIIGAGYSKTIISGVATNYFAKITSSNVSIQYMKIAGFAYAGSGEGNSISIKAPAGVDLTGVDFKGVWFDKCVGSGGDGSLRFGAADPTRGVTATLSNCLFTCNTNALYGGAIFVSGNKHNITITSSYFESNDRATDGGAIYVGGTNSTIGTSSVLSLNKCSFKNNSSGGYGGAVCIDGARLNVNNSCFKNNTLTSSASSNYGSSICGFRYSVISITNSSFTGSGTIYGKGAVAIASASGSASSGSYGLTVNTCSFDASSPAPRAIYYRGSAGSVCSVTNCGFTAGGTILTQNTGTFNVSTSGNPVFSGTVTLVDTNPTTSAPSPTCLGAVAGSCGAGFTIDCTTDMFPPIITSVDMTLPSVVSCNYTIPSFTAYDDCDGSPTVSSVPPAGTVLAAGTTTSVVITAIDASGNSSTSTINVVTPACAGCTTPSAAVIGTITQPTCATPTGSVDLSGLPASGSWTVTENQGSTTITGTGTTATFSGLAANKTYKFTVSVTGGCTSAASADAVINTVPTAPVAPTATVTTQPTCVVTTGTITVTSPAMALNVTYTVTGTAPVVAPVTNSTGIFSGLAPGTYSVTTTNTTTSCTSTGLTLTINAVPTAPVAPTASVSSQPTCVVTTGTITVTSPVPAINVTYTVTGTAPVVAPVSNTTGIFSGLAPGIYSVITTNTTTSCTSTGLSLTVNAVPSAPVLPTASVTTQSSCGTPTATITVTAPVAAPNVTYTLTGTAPVVAPITNATGIFSGLAPGDYSITTTNTTTSCTSSGLNLTVSAIPLPPVVPSASVSTQPTCTTPTGTITITSPVPAINVTYTVTGTAPVVAPITNTTGIFTGLAPGDYSVKTTNTTTTCTSTDLFLTVAAVPTPPVAPTATVTTQPTCAITTGTITVTSPVAALNVTYTVTGTAPVVAPVTNTTGVFSGLTPGDYSVTTTNTTTSCTSTGLNLTVSAVPSLPSTPTATVSTQPTCTTPTGTITVTAPAVAINVTYTVTGTSPVVAPVTNTTGIFTGLAPGDYSVTTTNTSTSCTSTGLLLTVAAVPTPPVAPVASVTVQPTCISPSGTIVVTSPAVALNVTYTLTGTIPVVAPVTNSTGVFTGLNPGDYTVTTTNTTTSCTSTGLNLTVNVNPGAPSTPVATVTTQPSCGSPLGEITVTSPLPAADVTYTLTGTAPIVAGVTNTTGIFSGLTSGIYSLVTTNTTSSCVSASLILTVNVDPTIYSAPTATVTTQPSCGVSTGTITVTSPSTAVNVTYTVTGTLPVVAAVTNSTGIFTGLTPGTYSVITSNTASGCTSPILSLTVNADPTIYSAPTATVTTQPSCGVATGTITVTAPSAAIDVTYTVTGTAPVLPSVTNTTGIFTGLTPGNYSVISSNTTSGCNSPILTLTVNTDPTIYTAPTATVSTQPSCGVSTGTITVTSPATAFNVTYTVTGTLPVVAAVTNSTGIFTGLTPGTYSVITANTVSGCNSPILTLTVNADPTIYSAPTASVSTQPSCGLATGTITVTAPSVAIDVTYTITGTAPLVASVTNTTGIFTGLTPGDYTVISSNTTSGCTSPILTLTVNADPTIYSAPTASVSTQPSCGVATGTITVTAPSAAIDVTYTITGTAPIVASVTNTTGIFTGLTSGVYSVISTNISSGCISPILSLTVYEDPTIYSAPTGSVTTQPSCGVSKGTITVSSPIAGLNITFTVIGTAPVLPSVTNTSGIFTGLTPGNYIVITTNTSTGCSSPTLPLTVNVDPTIYSAPTATVTTQPSCGVSKGTITVTSPATAIDVTYTLTGTTPLVAAVTNSTGIFTGLTPGDYTVISSNTTSGCSSPILTLTVNADPTIYSAPTATVTTQPSCGVATGTITVTSPATAIGITYTVTGTAPVLPGVTNTTGIFTGLTPGIYSVISSNTTSGCSSPILSLTVNADPTIYSAPTATVTTQPSCGVSKGVITVSSPVPALNITYTVTGTLPVVAPVTNTTGVFPGLTPGTYSVISSNTSSGCNSPILSLTVNADPTIYLAPTATVTTQPSCIVTTGTITVTSPIAAVNVAYTVSGTAPVVAPVTNNTGIFPGLTPGTYSVISSNTSSGCNSPILSLTVNAQPLSPLAPTGDGKQFFCSIPTEPVVSDLKAIGTSIKWYSASNGGTLFDPTSTLQNNTHYYASQTIVSGCESSVRLDVLVHLSSLAAVEKSITKPFCGHSDGNIVVTASNGIGNYSYVWNEGTSNDTIAKIGIGSYSVIVTDSVGCTSKLTFEISCKHGDIPQVISANGNGKNETWVIHADPKASVEIYNRWGSLVYSALPYNDDWNGQTNVGTTMGNQGLPSGTYFYMIDNKDGEKPVSGYIELIK